MGGIQSAQSNRSTIQWYDKTKNSNENYIKISILSKSSIEKSNLACSHNTRAGVSAMDLVEHAGNDEKGSIIRDVIDVITGKEEIAGADQKSNTRNVS